jgi:hypothetical protein
MRQDPNAVPYPRASYEQISYQEPTAQEPPAEEFPAQWPQPQQAPPAYQAAQQPDYPGDVHDDTAYGVYDPAYDAYDAYNAVPYDAGVGLPADPADRFDPSGFGQFRSPWHQDERPVPPEAEAALAQVRAAQRKARRMQVVCVLLGVCAAAIFLVAAASHQLDGHIEVLTPVLLLSSAANFRRYAQRMATYRAAEADILTRVR